MLLPLTPLHEAWGKDSEPGVYVEPKYEQHKIQEYKPTEVNVNIVNKSLVKLLHPKTKKERTDMVTNALLNQPKPVIETFVQYKKMDTHILLIMILLIVVFVDKVVSIFKM